MRGVSTRIGFVGGLLLLLAVLTSSAANADEPGEPLENRIRPPGGIAAPRDEPTVSDSQTIRILPPGGGPTAVRVSPPIGTRTPARQLSFAELFWLWLQAHARISPPIS